MTVTSTHRNPEAMPPPEMQRVDDGIYAYVQLDGSWGLNNTGVVVGSRYAIVIDTLFTEARNHAFRDQLSTVASVPITTLVNTHHHGDHTWGNALYPQATIVAHERCRQETIETGLSIQSSFPGVDFGHIDVVPAFATFTDRFNLYVDDLKLELHFVGPAHTTNDSVVWLPDRKLLFAGDVAFNGGTPFFVQGSLVGHIAAVRRLKEFGAERIVPGHGAVCGPEALDAMLEYLHFVDRVARDAYAAGVSPLEAAKQTDLGAFAELSDSERIVANLHRAYSELRGEPLGTPMSLGGVFPEMIEYNGGPIHSCA